MHTLRWLHYVRNDHTVVIARTKDEAISKMNILVLITSIVSIPYETRFIYILTNYNNTTLYVGVTSNLIQRIQQHKNQSDPKAFTTRYRLNKLVYYEAFQMIGDAIGREKQLKAGSRAKKEALIQGMNPNWLDLYEQVLLEYEE